MSLDLYKQAYIDRIEQLAGDQRESLLFKLISQQAKFSKKGEAVFTDGMRPLDPASSVAFADYATYKRLYEENTGMPDYATYIQSVTEHKEIIEQRSLLLPLVGSWSRWFDQEDEIGQFLDPMNDEIECGVAEMETWKDQLILAAMTSDSVSRGKGDYSTGVAGVAMPVGQILAATEGTRFSVADATAIEALFKTNWVGSPGMLEQIYVIISPNQAKAMKDNDVQVTDRDFVSSYTFEQGGLPQTFGIKYIEHPAVTAFAKAGFVDIAIAFTGKGCIWNQSMGRQNKMGETPSHKFSYIAQMKEIGNAVRQDDLRVAWINIAA